MGQLMQLIDETRDAKGLSKERFANNVGITLATYSRQMSGKTAVGIESIHLYAQYAKTHGHKGMLQALGAYALSVPMNKIKIEE